MACPTPSPQTGSKERRRGAADDAARRAELAEKSEQRRAHAAALDERVRKLRDEDGLSIPIIQARLGLSKGGVQSALERARAKRQGVNDAKPERSPPARSGVGVELLSSEWDDAPPRAVSMRNVVALSFEEL